MPSAPAAAPATKTRRREIRAMPPLPRCARPRRPGRSSRYSSALPARMQDGSAAASPATRGPISWRNALRRRVQSLVTGAAKHVAVLSGGWSAERAVSLVTGAAVAAALAEVGYRVSAIDAGRDVAERLA